MRDWIAFVREELKLPAMKGHREVRMIRELADHLEDVYAEAISGGASEEDAMDQAKAWLGDTDRATAELLRSEPAHLRTQLNRWSEGSEERLRAKGGLWAAVSDRVRDLRLAIRSLAKRPVFTGVVVFVLALGIGATTAIFTLLDVVILSPLPYDAANRLVAIDHTGEGMGIQSAGQCAAWHFTYESENRVFEDIGLYGDGSSTIIHRSGEPEAVPSLGLTSGVLRALRLKPVVGRLFTPEDEALDAPNAILLGYGYWQSRYGGDPEVVGQVVDVNGATWEIAGVVPAEIELLGVDPAVVFPYRVDRSQLFVGNIGLGGIARLRDGVTLEQANADVARMLPLATEMFPGGPVADFNESAQYAPNLLPLKASLVGSVVDLLWLFMAGVAVVLLIACANVANLFLVRADGKRTEMAVRTAMGASQRRIGWEYLKESLLLGVLGGVVGLVFAKVGLRILIAMAPVALPRVQEVSLNPQVLLFALVVSLGAGLAFGALPALWHGRARLVDALKQGARSGTSKEHHRAQHALAVSQMALALVLLVASGLMLRSFVSLRNVDPGFRNAEDLLAVRLFIPFDQIADAGEVALHHEQIAHRLGEIPGVTSVGLSSAVPMHGTDNVNPFYVDGLDYSGDEAPPLRRHKWLGQDFLETMQIPLLLGRTFTWNDIHDRIPAALVSERLAREYWGSPEAAIGQRIAARPDPPRWHEVIGVVADVREDGLGARPPLLVYWPQATLAFWGGSPPDQVQTWRSMSYAIRSGRVGTTGFLREVREAIWEVDPTLPLLRVREVDGLVSESMAQTSFALILLMVAAGVALLLGIIGVYGVISYAVSQRTSELGMRVALGARSGDVIRMVLRQGFVLAVVGLAIGLALSFGLTGLMSDRDLLYGVSPRDPVTFALVPALLLGVAILATYVPARRAARVNPMDALRAE